MARVATKKKEEETKETMSAIGTEVSIADLFALMQNIQKENEQLKTELSQMKNHKSEQTEDNTVEGLAKVLKSIETGLNTQNSISKTLRSNREVTIVHNAQLHGGLKTDIKLSTVDIIMDKLGETRTISWEQFEEMCSKYRGFIDEGIIMIAPEYKHLCGDYKIQCFENGQKDAKLTSDKLLVSCDMTEEELTSYFNALNTIDKKVLLDYWLGKCYARPEDRNPKFYNRYKLELLNHLSGTEVFNNILADMN